MRMNNWIKYSLSLGLVALIGACSVATSMDATLEREVEATTELKEKAKEPSLSLIHISEPTGTDRRCPG